MKLTKTVIDHARYPDAYVGTGRRHILWDDEVKGFGVRIYDDDGCKTFVLSYRVAGRKRLMKLGRYGVLTLQEARQAARMRLGEVLGGADPLADRQREQRCETMRELCEVFIAKHARPHKKSWQEDANKIRLHVLPEFGGRKVHSITRAEITRLHLKVGETAPYQANRVVALLSKVFEFARSQGMVDDGAVNPARGIKRFEEKARDRFVTHFEAPRLAEAIDQEPSQQARAALWLYLLTGLRKQELLTLRWEQIDFGAADIRLADTKAGRPHRLPLSPPALSLLSDLPREAGNPYVFPGRKAGSHLVNISKAWDRVRIAAKLEDVRLHDLRRTVGSWLVQSGHSLPLIGKVLNHTQERTTAVYARLQMDQTRAALDSHGEQVMKVMRRPRLVAVGGEGKMGDRPGPRADGNLVAAPRP